MNKEKIHFIVVCYDGESVDINKTTIPVLKVEDGRIFIDSSVAHISHGTINIEDVNKPRVMSKDKLPIYIELYSYNQSKFETRQLIRQSIVNEMDEQRLALMQFIANFEYTFINTDT